MTPLLRNLDGGSRSPDPSVPVPSAERVLPYDPAEWEAKLEVARARRAKVLEQRMIEARAELKKTHRPAADTAAPGSTAAPPLLDVPVVADTPKPADLTSRRRIHPRPVARETPEAEARRVGVAASVPLWLAVVIGIGLAVPLALLLTQVKPPQLAATTQPSTEPEPVVVPLLPLPTLDAPLPVRSVPAPPATDAIQVTLSQPQVDLPGAVPLAAPIIAAAPPVPPVADLPPPPPLAATANQPEAVTPPPAVPRPDPQKEPVLAKPATFHLHVPQKSSGPAVASVTATLRDVGFKDIPVAQSPYTIRETQVRYYHKQDAGAAALAAGQTGALLRDFTDYSPKPDAGVIEIWMAGTSPSPKTTTARQSADNDLTELNPAAMVRSIGSAISDLIETFPRGNER